jgi:PAS domain S-box-containing protein
MIMDKKPTYEELEKRVQEFDFIESEFKKTMTALQKRVKELNCLYGISHFVESEKNLSAILQETANLVPGSWQYPEVAACQIILNENLFSSCSHCEKTCDDCPHAFMRQPIIVNGAPSGEVRVCYLEKRPEADEGPFLREERDLLNAVAERLGRIAERKQAEEALRESEKRLIAAQRIAKLGDFTWDVETGEITWSDALFEMMKYDKSEKFDYARVAAEIRHPDDSKRIDQWLKDSIASGKDVLTPNEYRLIRKDGEIIHVRVMGVVERKQEKSSKVFATVQDITEHKRAEEALRNSEQLLNDMGSIAKIGGWEHDLVTGKAVWTKEVYEIVEIESDPIPGPDEHLSYYPEESRMRLDEAYRLAIETGEHFDLKLQCNTAKGRRIWVRAIGHPEFKDGKCVKMKGTFQDITEQKQLENQLRQSHKMESVGTLAGGIAHDFNNILGIILGNTELALDDVPEWNPARLNLEEVITASLRAKDVIRQLLSFARKTKLEKKPTNITSIIKESLKMLRASIPTSIDIRQNIPEDLDTILADPTQINQVLINLCTNADHSMPHGGIIEVTLENLDLDEDSTAQYPELRPGRYVHLIVRDTGHGIPQEDMENIFDPYFTTKEVGSGTGMGLAVVHGIVREHNGIIAVRSEPEKGTTFDLFFPAVEQKAVAEIVTDEELPTGSERILFIDDEESIVKLGRQRLERLGYTVQTATSPLDALAMFQSKPHDFDLIISDMTMPDMTGDRLVKEVLNIRPNLPIILCTGFSEKIDELKATTIGAADYIGKPFDKYDLAFKVRKALEAAKNKAQE